LVVGDWSRFIVLGGKIYLTRFHWLTNKRSPSNRSTAKSLKGIQDNEKQQPSQRLLVAVLLMATYFETF
jgi:hypothetical protein